MGGGGGWIRGVALRVLVTGARIARQQSAQPANRCICCVLLYLRRYGRHVPAGRACGWLAWLQASMAQAPSCTTGAACTHTSPGLPLPPALLQPAACSTAWLQHNAQPCDVPEHVCSKGTAGAWPHSSTAAAYPARLRFIVDCGLQMHGPATQCLAPPEPEPPCRLLRNNLG